MGVWAGPAAAGLGSVRREQPSILNRPGGDSRGAVLAGRYRRMHRRR